MTGIFEIKQWIRHIQVPYPPPREYRVPVMQELSAEYRKDLELCHEQTSMPIVIFELDRVEMDKQLAYYKPARML